MPASSWSKCRQSKSACATVSPGISKVDLFTLPSTSSCSRGLFSSSFSSQICWRPDILLCVCMKLEKRYDDEDHDDAQ